eukprot:TRINITY_DN1566_c4_g1_i1.p1 TRINITY_DN1566_c4_g1~~TRINITY_DN1566_c4_g1_i1.p1  ORF type:complete len:287 (-),score=49.99 TRINITY_DN1566_c4_g1_i1:105-911(-)
MACCKRIAVLSQKHFLRTACRGLVTAQSPKQIKRFYQDAGIEKVDDFWRVTLDGKVVKTPKGTHLDLPARSLAQRLAQEWQLQGEHLKPQEMPLTTLGCTTVDLVRPNAFGAIERMLPYLSMDTVCFQDDDELFRERQEQEWGPLRKWFQDHYGVKLGLAKGIGAPGHPAETLVDVEYQLLQKDAWELCALEVATQTAKSFIVAAALIDKIDSTPTDALRWANLEEDWQIERWGLVEGDHDVAQADILTWMESCQRFSKLHRDIPPES